MIIKKLKLLHVAGTAFIPSLSTGCFSNEPLTKTCEKAEQSEHCIAELFRKMFIKKRLQIWMLLIGMLLKIQAFQRCFAVKNLFAMNLSKCKRRK